MDQKCALVSLPENYGTNIDLSGWSWSTETPSPALLSVHFLMGPNFFPFVTHFLILGVPKVHDAKRGTSFLKSRNIGGGSPSFASLNMYLGWR